MICRPNAWRKARSFSITNTILLPPLLFATQNLIKVTFSHFFKGNWITSTFRLNPRITSEKRRCIIITFGPSNIKKELDNTSNYRATRKKPTKRDVLSAPSSRSINLLWTISLFMLPANCLAALFLDVKGPHHPTYSRKFNGSITVEDAETHFRTYENLGIVHVTSHWWYGSMDLAHT